MLLTLSPRDLALVRFRVSPWWEAVTAIQAVQNDPALHRRWRRRTLAAMAADPAARGHWDVLRTFVLTGARIADALTPTPEHDETFAQSRDRVLAQPADVWDQDLAWLRALIEHPAAIAVLDAFAADPARGVERLCEAVTWFWELAVEPHWSRIHAIQVADIDHRQRMMARGGLEQMLQTLHPQVRRVESGLDLVGKCCELREGLVDAGLTLIPCIFAWPGTLVLNRAPFAPTLTYAPRGAGAMWEQASSGVDASPLALLMGGTRAGILVQLDVPMTTSQVAEQLGVAPATANDHLKVLTGARLLRAIRRGREVYYARTELGDEVCAPEGELSAIG